MTLVEVMETCSAIAECLGEQRVISYVPRDGQWTHAFASWRDERGAEVEIRVDVEPGKDLIALAWKLADALTEELVKS